MDNIDTLRSLLKDMDGEPEVVLQVLLEQGWVTEKGRIAPDLEPFLDEASVLAFEDPIGD